MNITENQLREIISNVISESLDEVNWFQRTGNRLRNAFDNAKTQVGGAAAGLKAGVKYGGGNAATAARNDYLAKRNGELAAGRQEEANAAIEKLETEYRSKLGELNKWKAKEVQQIKQMYGADAFANRVASAQDKAAAARKNQADFWQGGDSQGYSQVAEAVENAIKKFLKEQAE